MDPTPFFIMGTMFGVVSTMLVQAYGRRKVRQAEARILSSLPTSNDDADRKVSEVDRLAHRVAVLERIAVDHPAVLSQAIEHLR
jgi:hypothetical protein